MVILKATKTKGGKFTRVQNNTLFTSTLEVREVAFRNKASKSTGSSEKIKALTNIQSW